MGLSSLNKSGHAPVPSDPVRLPWAMPSLYASTETQCFRPVGPLFDSESVPSSVVICQHCMKIQYCTFWLGRRTVGRILIHPREGP